MNKIPEIGTLLLIPVIWFGAYVIPINEMIVLNFLILSLMAMSSKNQGILVLTSLIIGFFSDLAINGFSKIAINGINNNKRSKALQKYFSKNGTIFSAIFAATLTALMVLNTHAVLEIFGYTDPDSDLSKETQEMLIGVSVAFIVGAVWGAVVQDSNSMKTFRPFYNTTWGPWENRFWDGIAVAFAMGIIYLLHIAFKEFPPYDED
jgi:hypothetical protein